MEKIKVENMMISADDRHTQSERLKIFLHALKNFIARIGGIVVIIFGPATLEAIRVPWFYADTCTHYTARGSYASSDSTGIFFAAGWSLCIGATLGATLGAILTMGLSQQTVGQAMWLASGYSLGLGIPFLVMALGLERALDGLNTCGHTKNISRYAAAPTCLTAIIAGLLSFLSPLCPSACASLFGLLKRTSTAKAINNLWRSNMFSKARKFLFLSVVAVLFSTTISACSMQGRSNNLPMMPMDKMPAQVQSAPVMVQTAYQFAAANPDVMKNIPCYCGCGKMGHTSNYDCYVSNVDGKGKITFDDHALGCSICVDITQDAVRLLKEGKTTPEIKAYIDTTYSKYGTSNMP